MPPLFVKITIPGRTGTGRHCFLPMAYTETSCGATFESRGSSSRPRYAMASPSNTKYSSSEPMCWCVPPTTPGGTRDLVEEDDVPAELALEEPAHLDCICE